MFQVDIECFENTHRASTRIQEISLIPFRDELASVAEKMGGSVSYTNECFLAVLFFKHEPYKTFLKEIAKKL